MTAVLLLLLLLFLLLSKHATRGTRRTDQYFITTGPVDYYESVRSDFLRYFSNVETYCVSIEYNHVNKECHLDAYLKLCDLCSLSDVRECLEWFEGTINIQSVRSR